MEFLLALAICALLALLVKKLSMPSIPAYIIAGLILGNAGIGFFKADETSKILSELGIVFLLFYIGLQILPGRILERRHSIIFAGLTDFAVNFSMAYIASIFLGFDVTDAFVLASALYISSSAIVIQSLIDGKKLIFPESETIIWLMIFEDIVLILLILAVTVEAGQAELLMFFGKTLIFVLIILLAGSYAGRYINTAMRREDEVPFILAFSLPSLTLYLSRIWGVSESFGAILLGMAFSKVREIGKVIRPFKEVFLVLFFFFFAASIQLPERISVTILLSLILVSIIGKFLSGAIIGRVVHKSTPSGMEIGASMVARGEFSILLASIYGVDEISAMVALVVVVMSIAGSITARYSHKIRKIAV
jgi:CPA2 family monovalent cation:H+ antiporter-2